MSVLSRGGASSASSRSPITLISQLSAHYRRVRTPIYTTGCLIHHVCGIHDIRSPPKVQPNTLQVPKYKPGPDPKRRSKGVSIRAASPKTTSDAQRALNKLTPTGTVAYRVSSTYASQLAAKGKETTLYEAPSHTWYTIGSLCTASFCFVYAGYNSLFHILYLPHDIAFWVPYAYAFLCTVTAAMGTYFFLGPAKLIAYIKAVPATEELLKKTKTKVASESNLLVEVGIRRPIFGFGPRKVYVAPREIVMRKKLSAPLMTYTRGELEEMERKLKQKTEEEIRYDKAHLMTAPFRQTGRAFRELFYATRRIMSKEGLANIKVGKRMYHIDVSGGWALEDGRAIDRLVAIDDGRR